MARCDHGFERSVVPCPVCDQGKPERAATSASSLTRAAKPTLRRVRGQGEPITEAGSYRCNSCGLTKPLSEFYRSRTNNRGHQHKCKTCDNNKRTERIQRERGYV